MPSSPTLGHILTTINLERTTQVVRGREDPIRGNVQLLFQPRSSKLGKLPRIEELFGPLHVSIVLEGTLKVKVTNEIGICDDGEPTWCHHSDNRLLCRRRIQLHHGSFRMFPESPVEFPFEFFFPSHPVDSGPLPVEDTDDVDNIIYRPNTNGGPERLPPSYLAEVYRTRTRESNTARGFIEISYYLFEEVQMPGIDVRAISRGGVHGLTYRPLSDPSRINSKTGSYVENLDIRNYPKYSFALGMTNLPEYVRLGQLFTFELCLLPAQSIESSINDRGMVKPEIILRSVIIAIEPLNNITTRPHDKDFSAISGPVKPPAEHYVHLQCKQYPAGSFLDGKHTFYNGRGYTKTISTVPLKGLVESFTMTNVTLKYHLRVEVVIVTAGQELKMMIPDPLDLEIILPTSIVRSHDTEDVDEHVKGPPPAYPGTHAGSSVPVQSSDKILEQPDC